MVKLVELLMGPKGDMDRCPLFIGNGDELTPLHCCALFNAPAKITRILMESPWAKKASAIATERFGVTALHIAVASSSVGKSIENIEALATKKASKIVDSNKRTPLAVALENPKSTKDLIKLLLSKYPDAATIKGPHGYLPLHLAAQWSRHWKASVIQLLMDAYPRAVQVSTKRGNTPLHEACANGASASVVMLLLKAYPEATVMVNEKLLTPLDLAVVNNASSEVYDLLTMSPAAVKRYTPDEASCKSKDSKKKKKGKREKIAEF